MTTGDDFQAALDRDPTAWQTRLVFADWLDDRDDSRAEGYRALGALRRLGAGADFSEFRGEIMHELARISSPKRQISRLGMKNNSCVLPQDWYMQLPREWPLAPPEWYAGTTLPARDPRTSPYRGTSRRAAEDAAARAFALLPAARRAELLAGATHARA